MSARKEKPKTPCVLKVTHIRRCHVCGTVNESEESANMKCHDCGKYLAPFYYFDESKLDGVSDTGLYFSQMKAATEFNPLYGLSHYWVEEVSEKDSEDHESQSRGHKKSKRSHSSRHSRNRS